MTRKTYSTCRIDARNVRGQLAVKCEDSVLEYMKERGRRARGLECKRMRHKTIR